MPETQSAQKIVWLASYPKSGNTWLRAFLANLRDPAEQPADINNLGGGPIASARQMFDDATGIESSDLTITEIDAWRPAVYDHIAAYSEETLFLKIHDAFGQSAAGVPLASPAATSGVLYLIRNPLDVAVSYAHHMAVSVDVAIAAMSNENHALAARRRGLANQLYQHLSTWSGHVISWIDQSGLPVQVMRYEDMWRHPLETFSAAVDFLQLPYDRLAVERAIKLSSFEVLQAQELESGFVEKPASAASFFRRGKIGSWREELNDAQVSRIIADHGQVMRRYGYLTDCGEVAD